MPPFPGRSTPGPALAEPAAKAADKNRAAEGISLRRPVCTQACLCRTPAQKGTKKRKDGFKASAAGRPKEHRTRVAPFRHISLAKRSAGFVAHPSTSFLTKFPPRGGAAGCSSQVHHTMPGRHLQAFAPCRGTFLGPALISGCRRRGKPGPRSRPAPGKCWRRDRRRWAAACRRPVCRPHPGCSRRR